jgi:hypothetical protein
MKLIVLPILMLLVLLQSFTKALIILDYTINKNYIARNLCENRNKPMLHCNGRCQLAKNLDREDKPGNTNDNSQGKLKFSETVFTYCPALLHIDPLPMAKNNYPATHFHWLVNNPLPSIFRPPCM